MTKKTCRLKNKEFRVREEDKAFLNKISPVFAGKKYPIPTPTLCPEARMQRRLAFRNENSLYHRKCLLSGNQIISIYAPEGGYEVLSQEEWWGDNWNALDYGKELDFNRPFFEQFSTLLKSVPKMHLVQQGQMFNASFCNCASNNKNCYLIFNANGNEESLYGSFVLNSNNCIDNFNLYNSENCYECVDTRKSYKCYFCNNIQNSNYLYHSKDCDNCSNCIACIALSNKNQGFHILNKPVSKEIFDMVLSDKEKYTEVIEKMKNLEKKVPKKYSDIFMGENASGNYLKNVKNIFHCFDGEDLEECAYSNNISVMKNAYDVSYYGCEGKNEMLYECEGCGHGVYNVRFSKLIWGNSKDIFYSYECFNCENCFGCTGLKSKKYCIFNKEYSKEEYETMVPKIIEHMEKNEEWGEFFPASISPFGYNETVAHDYYPITPLTQSQNQNGVEVGGFQYIDINGNTYNTQEEIGAKIVFKWKGEEKKSAYIGETYLPLSIENYKEEIVGKQKAEENKKTCLAGVVRCEETGKFFKIIKKELDFYIKNNLEIPRIHPDVRYLKRFAKRNKRELFERTCDKCGKNISSVYPHDSKYTIYCQTCYNHEVY